MSAPEVAVGAVVVHDGRLLLVRRGRGAAAGRWSLPGGRVRFAEPLRAAVARELREETGLDVEVGELAGWVERTGTEPAAYHYVILDFFARPREPHPVPRAGDDAADARWVPIPELDSYDLVEGLLEFLCRIGSVRT